MFFLIIYLLMPPGISHYDDSSSGSPLWPQLFVILKPYRHPPSWVCKPRSKDKWWAKAHPAAAGRERNLNAGLADSSVPIHFPSCTIPTVMGSVLSCYPALAGVLRPFLDTASWVTPTDIFEGSGWVMWLSWWLVPIVTITLESPVDSTNLRAMRIQTLLTRGMLENAN